MRKTKLGSIEREHRPGTSRRGTMLLLAIFCIFLASALAALIMAGTTQLMRTSRSEHEMILVRQLTDSAWTWILAHKGLESSTPVTLGGKGLLPEGVSGEVRISHAEETQDLFDVAVIVRFSAHHVLRTTQFRLPS